MKNSQPIAIIGGYDSISKSFYSKIKIIDPRSIFLNIGNTIINRKGVYNLHIYELKKILETLRDNKIKDLVFLGKIYRPNLKKFKSDGVIDNFIPLLVNLYKKGDGALLSGILEIFKSKGFKILSPNKISNSFFLKKNEYTNKLCNQDRIDGDKSVKILNSLSKYDNAQSIVVVNGYILAIEAAEGTDKLLTRTVSIRKSLDQIQFKCGLLVKIPKKNQSKYIDLPVIGVKTLKLIKKANLNGILINHRFTLIHNKPKFLEYAQNNNLKIYSLLK